MSVSSDVRVTENTGWASANPKLAVLVPFMRFDPRPLLGRLDEMAAALGASVEILALDDGGGDQALIDLVADQVRQMESPSRLLVLERNEGRAKGRNRLVQNSRAHHLLLIDCDMAPDHPNFLVRYMELAAANTPVACGGFSVADENRTGTFALHWALQSRAECLPAAERQLQPGKYVYTSNLLVRRDVFEVEAFDESFDGWGWEDVEWGIRVAERFGVVQIDNTATHLGLDTPQALARKYEQSVGNFGRLARRHPAAVATYPSYRLARVLKKLPWRQRWRQALKAAALNEHGPLQGRVFAMKLYRAALYADAV